MDATLKSLLHDEQDRLGAAQELVEIAEKYPDLVLRVARAIGHVDDDTDIAEKASVVDDLSDVDDDSEVEGPSEAEPEVDERTDEDHLEALFEYLRDNPGWRAPGIIQRHTGIPTLIIKLAKDTGKVAVHPKGKIKLLETDQHDGEKIPQPKPQLREPVARDEDKPSDEPDIEPLPKSNAPLARVEAPIVVAKGQPSKTRKPLDSNHSKKGKERTLPEILAKMDREAGGEKGSTITRDIVRAELSLADWPRTINELSRRTNFSVEHLERVLDDQAFEKVGNGYRLREG